MLPFHSAASIFPEMSEVEFSGLLNDIKVNGQRLPAIVWQGQIIDGRNRALACERLGLELGTEEYTGAEDSVVSYVLSLNLERRHLKESQRAMVAARISTMRQGARTDRNLSSIDERSQSVAANLLGVGKASVDRAQRVLSHGTPELVSAVDQGMLAVSAAAAHAKDSPEVQREFVRHANEMKRQVREFRAQERSQKLTEAMENVPDNVAGADLRVGDFREVLSDLSNVDVILTDPPYPIEYIDLYAGLSTFANSSLKPDGVCVVMVGITHFPLYLEKLTSELEYYWTISYLTPGGQATQIWNKKVNTFWKPCIVLTKRGQFPDIEWFGDVASSGVNASDKRFHDWGQSESGMLDLVERLTQPGQLVCDPFMGPGTTGVVSLASGRRFVGCDVDEGSVVKARLRIHQMQEIWNGEDSVV